MDTKCKKDGQACAGEECTHENYGACPHAETVDAPVTPPYTVGGYPCSRDPLHVWPEYKPQ